MSPRSASSALTLAAAAVLTTGGAHAIDIDFTGQAPGSIAGRTTTATPSGGVSANAPGVDTWGGSPDFLVENTSLGTAGSETSEVPILRGNSSFSPGTFLGLTGVSNEEFWLSTLISVSANSGGFSGVELYRSGTELVGVGNNGFGSRQWQIIGGGGLAVNSGVVATPGETALLVLHYDASQIGAELEIFVNPDLNGLAPAPNATASRTVTGVNTVNIRSSVGAAVDNIYVGNVSPFVVPEPATAALLALGGVTLLGRRRA